MDAGPAMAKTASKIFTPVVEAASALPNPNFSRASASARSDRTDPVPISSTGVDVGTE